MMPKRMATLKLKFHQYLELEKLTFGVFAPLTGFMDEQEFHSVVESMRLPAGTPFPLPVVLDLSADQAAACKGAGTIILTYENEEVGLIQPTSFFRCDKVDVAKKIYGTDDRAHPGVKFFYECGDVFVGGPVTLRKRVRHELYDYELTPAETKRIFEERNWKTVVGFQTRNVPHRAHEYLQRVALEHVDGLFVQPLVGRREIGDYTPEAILTGYRVLIDRFFSPSCVVLGILTTAMRYAGPREAVFHAIIRRNFGCTHFVVGRDHAGVGDYYGKYDAHDLTRRFAGELGIEIMRLYGPYHCAVCDSIVTSKTCQHESTRPEAITYISGTQVRKLLSNGHEPAPHLMRPEVSAALKGTRLFICRDDL